MIFKDYGRRTLEYDFLPVVQIVQSDQSMYSLNVFFLIHEYKLIFKSCITLRSELHQ